MFHKERARAGTTFFLSIDQWTVEVRTDVADYVDLLRFYLPSHFLVPRRSGAPLIKFNVLRRRPEELAGTPGVDPVFVTELKRHGLAWRADIGGRRASVAIDDRRRLPLGPVYHDGFLFPLSLLLLPSRAALIHGALVSDQKGATLVVGPSGAGKSTLALSFNFEGFEIFTDEHALIRGGHGGVYGGRFVNRVGVPSQSTRNFQEKKSFFIWHPRIGKYFLKPSAQNLPGRSCRIDKIVFPVFTPSGKRRIRRLPPAAVFKKLLLDDYYYHHSSKHLESYGRNHLDLLMGLADSAAGYSIRYAPGDVRRLPGLIRSL